MTGPAEGLRTEQDGPLASVTLCRPEVLNAQTGAMWAALREFGRNLSGDVRVVVVRGEGRSFSSGLDLTAAQQTFSEIASLPLEVAEARIGEFQQAFSWLRRPDLLTI